MSERHGAVVKLRPERREEYLDLHSAVWPEVEATISACNIRNYTIFLLGDLLFSTFEYVGDDFAADQAKMAGDPVTREWWSRTDPCQERLSGLDEGPMWADADEVWHLE